MNLVRAQHIRFREAVMTPGRAMNNITKAYTNGTNASPRDEVMDEILVGDHWVVLRATRPAANGRDRVMAERVIHASMVKDFEPEDDAPKNRKEKAA